MNAVAFRSNLTKMLLDARKCEWEVTEIEEEREIGSDNSPSREEIRRRCLEIQREWTPRERAKRAGCNGSEATWLPPVVSVCEME